MLDKLKAEWLELKRAPSGQRFVQCHERHQAREAPYLKPLLFFAAIFSFVVGVVLVFIPGPAILFFAISAALLAAESRAVASAFDKVETVLHRLWFAYRGRRRKRDARAKTQMGRLDERELEAAVRAAVAAKHAASDGDLNGRVPPSLGKVDMSSLQPRAADAEATSEQVDLRNLHPEAATGAPVDMSNLQPGAAGDVPLAPVPDVASAPVDMRNLRPASPHAYDPAAMQPRRATQKQPENPAPESNRPIDQRVVWMPRPPAGTTAGPVANAVAREQSIPAPRVADAYAPVTRTARPRIAGTMKIWSTDFPAAIVPPPPAPAQDPPRPEATKKSTIVVFPPPVQVASDGQTARRGRSAR